MITTLGLWALMNTLVPIETLDLSAIEQGWGKPQIARSVDGNPLRIGGKTYTSGLGTHAPSVFRIDLGGTAERFSAWVGIDDEVAKQSASAIFQVIGDGKVLWQSEVLRNGAPAVRADVDLKGVRRLVLKVLETEDGMDYDHANWAEAVIEMVSGAAAAVKPAKEDPVIIRLPKQIVPRLTGPMVFGVRPGNPLRHVLTAIGQKPINFSATGLPKGVTLDRKSGEISGKLTEPGDYPVVVTASNSKGKSTRTLIIRCGSDIALTPPMGWNTWQAIGGRVTSKYVEDNALALLKLGLKDHGFSYINIDDGWQGKRGGKHNAIMPNSKFPDMARLVSRIHGLGLRAGIYSTPWRGTYEGHIGGTGDNPDGTYDWIEAGKTDGFFRHKNYPDRAGHWKRGKYSFLPNDVKQWVDWKFDLMKYDWGPWQVWEVEEMRLLLANCGRDIIYSLSNSAPYPLAGEWASRATMWRTTGDMGNSWGTMRAIWRQQWKWVDYARPGHWNDPDMLLLGRVGWNGELQEPNLSPSEKRSHYSLWVLLSAPLLLSCDLPSLDEFTLSLLTNADVNDVNQDPLGRAARLWIQDSEQEVWVKQLANGDYAVGLFNLSDDPQEMTVSLDKIGLNGSFKVHDLWTGKKESKAVRALKGKVSRHGVLLVRLTPA